MTIMNRISSFIVASVITVIPATAIEIDCTPGNLRDLIGDRTDVSELVVKGQINAADLEYIASMNSLSALDLSDATIAAYSGDRLASGQYSAAADLIPPYSLFGTTATSVILPEGITAIGESAFGASAIESVAIPATVKEIGSSAFAGCASLGTITIPATVTSLGNRMFSGCTSLTDATILATVDSIGTAMFANCTSLAEITLQPSVTRIGDEAFVNCQSLESAPFAKSLKSIGNRTFYNSGLTAADLSQTTSLTIGDFAFADCHNLLNAKFGTDTSLGDGAFFNDEALVSVSLPASTTTIPAFTFKGASSVDPAQAVPNSVTRIGDYALTGWENATSFSLPTGLEYIGDNAMEGWYSIKEIHATANNAVPELGENVWHNVDQANAIVYVNEQTKEAFENAPQWKEFNIVLKPSGTDNIENDLNGSSDVTFRFEGTDLVITSKDTDIVNTEIYDIDGKRRFAKSSAATTVRVATDGWSTGVIVASVTLADHSVATVKLIRK